MPHSSSEHIKNCALIFQIVALTFDITFEFSDPAMYIIYRFFFLFLSMRKVIRNQSLRMIKLDQ